MLSSVPNRQIIDLFSGRDERSARIVRDLSSASLPPASLRSVTHRLVIGGPALSPREDVAFRLLSSGEYYVSAPIPWEEYRVSTAILGDIAFRLLSLGKNIASRRNSYTTLLQSRPWLSRASYSHCCRHPAPVSIRPATPPVGPAVGALPGITVIDSLCFYGSCTAYTH